LRFVRGRWRNVAFGFGGAHGFGLLHQIMRGLGCQYSRQLPIAANSETTTGCDKLISCTQTGDLGEVDPDG
jgi:hypothetical protein